MKSKIISIQLEFIFDKYWAAAIHRSNSTNIYHDITRSSWDRINRSQFKRLKGNFIGTSYNFIYQ